MRRCEPATFVWLTQRSASADTSIAPRDPWPPRPKGVRVMTSTTVLLDHDRKPRKTPRSDTLVRRPGTGGRLTATLVLAFALSIIASLMPTAEELSSIPLAGPVLAELSEVVVSEADAAVRHCGISTCTDYSSRSEVRRAAANIRRTESEVGRIWDVSCGALAATTGMVAASFTPIIGGIAGAVTWLGCSTLRWRYGSITDTIKAAASNGQCFAISFARYGSNNPAFATGWYRYNCKWG